MIELYNADCLSILPTLEAGSVDAIICDPPYGLSFMGKKWDYDIPSVAVWEQCFRVLKDGGRVLSFGSTRTYHRIVCNIEDAGFVIEDMVDWVYGSGFPKHQSKLKPGHEPICVARKGVVSLLNIDECRIETDEVKNASHNGGSMGYHGNGKGTLRHFGNGTSHSQGRYPANVVLSEDAAAELDAMSGVSVSKSSMRGVGLTGADDKIYGKGRPDFDTMRGHDDTGGASRFFKVVKDETVDSQSLLFNRAKAILEAWNPNLAHTVDVSSSLSKEHVVTVLKHVVTVASHAANQLNDVKELSTSVTPHELKTLCEILITATLNLERNVSPEPPHERHTPNNSLVKFVAAPEQTGTTLITISHWKSDGSAAPVTLKVTSLNLAHGEKDSRSDSVSCFRYCAKASRSERNAGLEGMPLREVHRAGHGNKEDDDVTKRFRTITRNHHPTVKPLSLMEWLVRLVCPDGGIVLDPFMGSGSTGVAALNTGRRFVGIERDAEYFAIAKRRIEQAQMQPMLALTG